MKPVTTLLDVLWRIFVRRVTSYTIWFHHKSSNQCVSIRILLIHNFLFCKLTKSVWFNPPRVEERRRSFHSLLLHGDLAVSNNSGKSAALPQKEHKILPYHTYTRTRSRPPLTSLCQLPYLLSFLLVCMAIARPHRHHNRRSLIKIQLKE